MQINNIAQPPAQAQTQPEQSPSPSPKKSSEDWRNIASTLAILLLAPLIALFLTTFVFQSYEVDGQSMESTLHHQDRLIIVKTGKTWASLLHKDYIPKRGEIVIFHKANLSLIGGETDKQLIKRVIALPGERIVIEDGVITVYNDEFPDGFKPDEEADYGDTLPPTEGSVDLVVPKGEIFVLGDNRVNSRDSREFGTVPSKDVVGHLALRIFPLNKLDSF